MTSKTHKLSAEKRALTGKKVKQLRRAQIIPANIYGNKIKSVAVQVTEKDFLPVYEKVGETGLIEVSITGEKKPRHVLVHGVQTHPVSSAFLHVDFHEVDLTEKMLVNVPVELVGESPAAEKQIGVLLELMSELEVEALPSDIPEHIEVDISGLAAVDDMIKVSDIKAKSGFTITEDPETVIVRINPLEKEEEAAPAPVAEGEEAAEGETPAETPAEGGESPSEEKKEE